MTQAQAQQPKEKQQQQTNSANGFNPDKDSKPIGETLLAPLKWTVRSVKWLTEPRSGSKYVLYTLCVYSLMLSTEALYVALPSTAKRPAIERRFMPKIGINDGSDISRLVNLSNFVATVKEITAAFLPIQLKIPAKQWTVWGDPSFYLCLVLAIAIGAIEARALRAVSISMRRKMAERLAKHRPLELDPKSLTIAKVRAAQYQNAGMGRLIWNWIAITGTYTIEFGSFFSSQAGVRGSAGLASLIYAFITVFGFEAFLSLADTTDIEADEEV